MNNKCDNCGKKYPEEADTLNFNKTDKKWLCNDCFHDEYYNVDNSLNKVDKNDNINKSMFRDKL